MSKHGCYENNIRKMMSQKQDSREEPRLFRFSLRVILSGAWYTRSRTRRVPARAGSWIFAKYQVLSCHRTPLFACMREKAHNILTNTIPSRTLGEGEGYSRQSGVLSSSPRSRLTARSAFDFAAYTAPLRMTHGGNRRAPRSTPRQHRLAQGLTRGAIQARDTHNSQSIYGIKIFGGGSPRYRRIIYEL